MNNNSFVRVDELAECLDVSKAYAYKLIREMNQELEAQGYNNRWSC